MQNQSDDAPTATVKMLIRRPATDVFAAFTDPQMLTKFWLSYASAPLELGKTVRWDFMVPGASVETTVTALEPNRRISIAWSDGSTVEWTFEQQANDDTIVQIENAGFSGQAHEVIQTALESTQGFTIVLCDLKILLEQGIKANLTRDKAALIMAEQKAPD